MNIVPYLPRARREVNSRLRSKYDGVDFMSHFANRYEIQNEKYLPNLSGGFFPQLVLNTARGTYIQDLPNALNSYLSVIPQQQQDSNRPAKGNLRKHGFYVRFREALIKRDSKKPSEFKWRKHCVSVVFGT